jgi:hypothetical protein
MPFFKARPPESFLSRTHKGNQHVFVVHFTSGNGVPTAAYLVPAVRSPEGRWCLSVNGRPVRDPTEGDVTMPAGMVRELSDNRVEVGPLDWPAGATAGMLFLVHRQIDATGDNGFGIPIVATVADPLLADAADDRVRIVRLGVDPATVRNEPAAVAHALGGLVIGVLEHAVIDGGRNELPGVRFALASCQYPAGIFDGGASVAERGFSDRHLGPAGRSLWKLVECCRKDDPGRPQFVVCAGDQVYVDATAGAFDPKTLMDGLSFAYAHRDPNYLHSELVKTGAELLCQTDDHEISDNWEPMPSGCRRDEIDAKLEGSIERFLEEQRPNWPATDNRLWDNKLLSGVQFFFADTRTEREGRNAFNYDTVGIIGKEQQSTLMTWIAAQHEQGGFIVSPSILVPRLLATACDPSAALACDSWEGYPKSFQAVLRQLCDTDARQIVFLSGDLHLSCVARITISRDDGREVVAHSVHSSALYAPYPFANAMADDLAGDDRFDFQFNGHCYSCCVETEFPRLGDGFAIFGQIRNGEPWEVEFVRSDDGPRERFVLSTSGAMKR